MNSAVEQFNGLNGTVADRTKLKRIAVAADLQGQKVISAKLEKLLRENPDDEEFDITLSQKEIDRLPEECLGGLECLLPDEDYEGLEKAVSPDEIYQYITDLMLNTIKEVGHLPWQKEWKESSLANGSEALNWKTKKKYRGINYFLLNFEEKLVGGKIVMVPRKFTNPFFLTFNQIKESGGTLKKGSKGTRIVYFTRLYKYEQAEPELSFGTYSFPKMVNWLKKNRSKIGLLNSFSPESIAAQNAIPILKYYNVFSAEDVEGVEWEIPEPPKRTEVEKIESADAIIDAMPKAPKINHGGGRAYYTPAVDYIQMPNKESFKKVFGYYSTLFHEMVHSTGHHKRVDRDMKGGKGTKGYAFEELIAEMGAVYLCAESGILFETRDNSAKYLKGWNSRLVKNMEEDNRFFFRAASQAQAASDFILDRDKEGVPAYFSSLKSELKKEEKPAPEKPKKRKPAKKKPGTKKSVKPTTNDLLEEQKKAKIQAKTKTEFEKGLRKIGFEIISYESDQVSPKEWERMYKLNYKDVAGLELEMKVKPEGKELEGDYNWKAIGMNAGSFVDYKNFQEFYEEILKDLQEVFGKMTIKEAEGIREEYKKTLFSKKEAKSQLGLFGSRAKKRIRKKKGLKAPVQTEAVAPVPQREEEKPLPAVVQEKPVIQESKPLPAKPVPTVVEEKPVPVGNPNSLAARMQRNLNRAIEYYKIEDPDIAKFLGQVEIKEKESVGISITAPQGAGKTRFAFQLINAFAKNYKVGHASMEEHPESGLYTDKAVEYIDPENFGNIDSPDINSMSDIEKLIRNNDVIVIDSFEKLREMDKNVQVDQDFRKKYDGKLFIFIFQLTSDGKMRGGSKSQFDVDIVLFTEKFDNYKENYIYPDKNRYNSIPPSELKFSIYNRALISNETTADVSDVHFEEVEESSSTNSRVPEFDPGELIITPID
ncbi:zincin-like metallopeptidase domain-containing protein [Salegentibacter sp. F188]|uniref:Zincin-like metallopeptidase domain-containing protein n=1 Tax=Autumnicola patrickiae TaxID=3075591 RepID=A0ABU3E0G9_9FLAO|nr:zincin-like metallopeptidase domain-containing protein [Salegentibacter sp. F188]MDT0689383.1 zincin-like metallopeptidase domain-containing protein [Salegentibacter sp. F188]